MDVTDAMKKIQEAKDFNLSSVIMVRHGKKDKTGKHILPEEIQSIIKNGIKGIDPNIIDSIVGSNLIRTQETGLAYAIYAAQNTKKFIFIPVGERNPVFGEKKFFSNLFPNGIEKNVLPIITAKKSPFYTKYLYPAVTQVNALLNSTNARVTLVVSHSPLIEMLADYYEYKITKGLKELDGFAFIPHHDGTINVVAL